MPPAAFLSYAHADQHLKTAFLDALQPLIARGLVTVWHDPQIQPGDEWPAEIRDQLDRSPLVFVLLSENYAASPHCRAELERALAHHRAGAARIFPILLDNVRTAPLQLDLIQALPPGGKPVAAWSAPAEAFAAAAAAIQGWITSAEGSPIASPTAPLGTAFPSLSPYLTGRDALVSQLKSKLDQTRRAALTGLPGVGKTQVARALVDGSTYSTILWANASSRESLTRDFIAFASGLRLPQALNPNAAAQAAAVREWLDGHHGWLLILDNADELDIVRDFLPRSTTAGHILLTTRAQATGDFGEAIEVNTLSEQDAALLLLRRAKRIEARATWDDVTPRDRMASLGIARELGCLPLALDQAGAFLNESQRSPAEFLNLYRAQGKKLRERRGRTALDHESVHVTFSLAIERVRKERREAATLLIACSFLAPDAIPEEMFPPSETDPLAWTDVLDVLGRYSLLRRDPDRRTLHIHRITQAVVQDTLTAEEKAAHAKQIVNTVAAKSKRPSFETWPQSERLLAQQLAVVPLIEQGMVADANAAWIVSTAGNYLAERSDFKGAEPLLQLALKLHQQIYEPNHNAIRQSLNDLGVLYNETDPKRALPFYEGALRLTKDDPAAQAVVLHNIARIHLHTRAPLDALKRLRESLKILRDLKRPLDAAQVLHSIGETESDLEHPVNARWNLLRALAIRCRALGEYHRDTLNTLNSYAIHVAKSGDRARAATLYERVLDGRRKALGEDHLEVANSLTSLGVSYCELNRNSEAEPLLRRALQILNTRYGPDHRITKAVAAYLARIPH
ncbi:MAG: tetratricopeptide repeat protein [Bryobacterales bacterium]|nr:tetratricopeptide repeat protein [Bryobacterales bacterium]